MKIVIRETFTNVSLYTGRHASLKTALEWCAQKGIRLRAALLQGVQAPEADLGGLMASEGDFTEANLQGCYLDTANLAYAKLIRTNARGADLTGANVYHAQPRGLDLRKASYSIPQMLQMDFTVEGGSGVDGDLCRDLMRLDASAHPNPSAFKAWARGGYCPLDTTYVDRAVFFPEARSFWQDGPPPSLWHLWCRLAAACDIRIGYDAKGRPVKETEEDT